MNYPKTLVALDHSALDKQLIQYSRFIAKNFGVSSIHFTHVVPFYLPPNLMDSSLESLIPKGGLLSKTYQTELAKDIQFVFGEMKGVDIKLSVEEGKPQTKILNLIEEDQPDLLVLGKKEIIRRLKESAKQSFHQFLIQNQLPESDLNFKVQLNDDFDVSKYIKETALLEKSDLIIIGAKGQSGLSGFVFGSVTEKLISTKETPPILVVR